MFAGHVHPVVKAGDLADQRVLPQQAKRPAHGAGRLQQVAGELREGRALHSGGLHSPADLKCMSMVDVDSMYDKVDEPTDVVIKKTQDSAGGLPISLADASQKPYVPKCIYIMSCTIAFLPRTDMSVASVPHISTIWQDNCPVSMATMLFHA